MVFVVSLDDLDEQVKAFLVQSSNAPVFRRVSSTTEHSNLTEADQHALHCVLAITQVPSELGSLNRVGRDVEGLLGVYCED
mmetsp:Transcript_34054/g.54489  ORF Transcript_34054/g.54489 Transcript_34054/m.54489 type:complete len:81 (+) Transcript_34054:1839-2081(+)